MNQGGPSKEELLRAYDWLDKERHPHNLLPLETRLPDELKYKSRDEYRIIMTMILAQGKDDKPLTKSLAKLFKRHPGFETFRGFGERQIEQLLREMGLGLYNTHRGGNGGRLWSFLECYFSVWGGTIAESSILGLNQKTGFQRGHFVRLLQAYRFGNNNVIPLDRPALNALRDPLFPAYGNFSDDEVRKDIENKLRGEARVSLIDFHEMLRFIQQYSGKSKKRQENIVIGWNGWRLLCSLKRAEITEKWIYDHLVKDKSIATELWRFFQKITNP